VDFEVGEHICHASVGGASGTDVWQAWEKERHERQISLHPISKVHLDCRTPGMRHGSP
jgi:hypothetical protein